jgi:hypothetical protein
VNFMTHLIQDIASLIWIDSYSFKMHHLWEYFSVIFSNPHKVHKRDKKKKAKSIRNYEAVGRL